jgi:predicted transcriptional regulator YheO
VAYLKKVIKTAMLTQKLYNERKLGVNEIAADLNISKMTLYKYLRHRGIKISGESKVD